ncbi:amino acid ABC transporter substrate-binding protein [Xanthomarina spongicola]|uniref:ABC-type branched-subunit amino acid transport system substrate-binding protein n=1 Tax=Xanthomarina spongicola TaxID=570520 RepID=A0A316DLA8_9FLAO|nr:LysM peptidoglycan-binding domain-containing protein [Xanthomarina spongicola]PWK18675.1 ABC-type branched-subunit amino acid transport system substrate-binding protein [Xanthomarina spongicola]
MKKIIYILSLVLMFGCVTTQAQNYKTHRVKQGETIESIAKQYQVTPYDIFGLNPDAKKGLKPNSVLIIPKSKVNSNAPQATIEKELIGFKEHKVRRKETLYSLCKEFDVTEDELKKHNTFLYANNLRKGDLLKVPVFKKVFTVSEPESTTKSYTVLPKEGKWRIAYKFGITIDELESLNPGMNEVLNVGEVINVPNINETEEKPIDEAYSYYQVLPKEGFYRLKLKLGIEQDQLETLNPGLKESGLKEGMVLKVPFSSSVNQSSQNEEISETNLTDQVSDYNTKHLVIMLPFQLNKVDIDSVQDAKRELTKNPYLSMSLDFHSGALVALDSLKKLGISLKVDVYDTKNLLSEVSHILNTNSFQDVDAVLGPFMPNNVEKVASELKTYNIPVVSPITKNVTLSENVFQSRPSEDLLYDKMINFVKNDSTINQIIIISDTKHTKVSDNLKRTFLSASLVTSRKNKKGEDAFYVLDEDISSKLKLGKNLVFLESDNPGFISNVTSKLNSFKDKDKDIILATTNMNAAFEDDEVSNYHLSHLQFHFPTISKAYNEDDKNSFVKTYEKRYGITPNKIAVRGFDLTMDVVLRMVTSEDMYLSVNEAPLTEYVENKFAYKKKFLGGYYNDTVYLVKYQDLKIVEVN